MTSRLANAGDAIDFLQLVTGLSKPEACKRFIELAGGEPSPLPAINAAQRSHKRGKSLPCQRCGAARRRNWERLQSFGSVSFAACFLADAVGLLRFATWKERPAWIVTDDERLNAQARRLDGKQWETIGAKAQTLPGSWASWPLGIKTGRHYPAFVLCEGGGDLLAALHFINCEGRECDCFPLAILGASQRIHPEALPLFAGKRVRIMAHVDKAGKEAAERWAAEILSVGADVDCADFTGLRKADGSPVTDLGDCTTIHPDDAKELEGLLPE